MGCQETQQAPSDEGHIAQQQAHVECKAVGQLTCCQAGSCCSKNQVGRCRKQDGQGVIRAPSPLLSAQCCC